MLTRSGVIGLHVYVALVWLRGYCRWLFIVMRWLWKHVLQNEGKWYIFVTKVVSMGMLGRIGSMGG